MDKNTITGLVLIGILLVGFSFLSRPSEEQIAAQKRYYELYSRGTAARRSTESQNRSCSWLTKKKKQQPTQHRSSSMPPKVKRRLLLSRIIW